MVYILSEVRLKRDFVDNSMESAVIQQAIRNSQDIFLRSIIGDYLLDTLEDMIENNTLTGEYKLLVDEYCIPYLEFRTMAELQMSSFKLNNAGVNQVYDSNISTLSVEQVKYLEQQYINRASYYENRMTKFLLQSGIPEYKMNTGITNASTTITEQTGLYLGGTKTKTTSKTAKANPQLEGVVRYDTYQKLTDDERRQIRENAGMYNYDDDKQFEYDKYYNKQQVNKIIDDIPIPQYTSELELDNVYSKAQVDTLIGDINEFSGDYNDLSNKPNLANVATSGSYNDLFDKPNVYSKSEIDNIISGIGSGNNFSGSYNDLTDKPTIPTKTSDLTLDNTYSRTQVDTLINQIPTFSGNYEDLTNKPSIYTKAETDTLISNINTFDGDYNSLTNKPDVYTKSQTYNKEEIDDLVANSGSGGTTDLSNYYTKSETYSKSEIDLQFESVNTTLGDINNILNEI